MKASIAIAADEVRLWRRSKVALVAFAGFALVLVASGVSTASRIGAERHERLEHQRSSEAAFLSQPGRHPHRMVHYGHYVFRVPPPLALVDPGVDSVTGQSIFLEGHRQNSAMFADTRVSANLGGFGRLTPAFVYQVLLPLLLIALGHGVLVRERESGTLGPLLAQGVSSGALYAGKALALVGLAAVMLLPLLLMTAFATFQGDSMTAGGTLALSYVVYLFIWCALILLVSSFAKSRGVVLGALMFVWLASVLVVPRAAVESASAAMPAEGKLETDLRMAEALKSLGDGHNAGDPAFAQLRANLLAEYDVETVEDLPINFRGVVAAASEARLTDVLNEFAEQRMELEALQTRHVARFGWLSPSLALAYASRTLSGVDLAAHHRFLREAEALRFDFVQELNRLHTEQLRFADDANRSQDPEAERRTRISPENWRVLDAFEFRPLPASDRVAAALGPLTMLGLWLLVVVTLGVIRFRRLTP